MIHDLIEQFSLNEVMVVGLSITAEEHTWLISNTLTCYWRGLPHMLSTFSIELIAIDFLGILNRFQFDFNLISVCFRFGYLSRLNESLAMMYWNKPYFNGQDFLDDCKTRSVKKVLKKVLKQY